MNVEYDNFVIARAGYNPKYKREVSWEELKKTFTLYKRIPMIIAGGDHYGPIDPNLAVGFVDAKMYDDEQIVRGEPVFYKERFDSIPPEIQQMLAHKNRVPASLGYEPYGDVRKIDHIAIGVDSPVFPDIGFNAEERFHYEETEGMNQPTKDTEEPAEPKQAQFVTKEDFLSFRDEVLEAIKAQQTPDVPDAPAEAEAMEPEAEEQTETPEEPPEAEPTVPQPKPKVEPERTLSRQTEDTIHDGMFKTVGETRIVSQPLGGKNSRTDKEKE